MKPISAIPSTTGKRTFPLRTSGEDIGVKHIIADIVHGALACALPVLATMIMAVRLAVLPVLPIGQRPAAIRTFYQSGKNLRCTILALPTAVCYLLLYLPENLLADNRRGNPLDSGEDF